MTHGKDKLQSAFILLGIIALIYSLIAIIVWLNHALFFITALGLESFNFDIATLGTILSLLIILSPQYRNISAILGGALVIFSALFILQAHYLYFPFAGFSQFSTAHTITLATSAKLACILSGIFFILKRFSQHDLFKTIQLILLYCTLLISLLAIIGSIFDISTLYRFNGSAFFMPLALVLLLLSLQNLTYFISKTTIFSLSSAHIPALVTAILFVTLIVTWKILHINQQQLHYNTMQQTARYAASEINTLLTSDMKATRRFFVRLTLLNQSPHVLEKDINQYFNDYANLKVISMSNISKNKLHNYTNPQYSITQAMANDFVTRCLDALQFKQASRRVLITFSDTLLCIQDNTTQTLAIFNSEPVMKSIFESPLFSTYYVLVSSSQNTIYHSPNFHSFENQAYYIHNIKLFNQPFKIMLTDKVPVTNFERLLSLLYFTLGILIIILIFITILSWQRSLRQNDALRELNRSLTQSNQDLDDFAYIASHDLKEPLRGIANFSSFLLEDYEDKLDNEGKMQLKTLSKLAKRMEALINDLLSFSRVGRVDFAIQPCDLNQILNDKLVLLQPFLEENQAKVIIKKPLPILNCDKVRIGEVFQNFITNGIKYNDSDQKIITIDYTETSNSYTFSVEDNGIGIKKEDFKKIFSIFKRLHAKDAYGGGTGAGMTISDKIIKRHGGEIWLTSKPSKGSIFYFSIAKTFDTVDNKES